MDETVDIFDAQGHLHNALCSEHRDKSMKDMKILHNGISSCSEQRIMSLSRVVGCSAS